MTSSPRPLTTSDRTAAFWPVALTLAWREVTRFLRQRSRVVGAFGQPIVFWVLFGAGLGGSFKTPSFMPEGATLTYQEYFLPGVTVLILLYVAIFSTISVIEDRREGFLQGVLVSPAPRSALVFGKLAGGTVLALIQAVGFLCLGPLLTLLGLAPPINWVESLPQVLGVLGVLTLLGLTLTALGYVIVWPMNSTQGFHAIMMVFLTPMWLLSGAFFPGEGAGWMEWVIRLNPLTYGVAALRRLMFADWNLNVTPTLPSLPTGLAVTTAFGLLCLTIAVVQTRGRSALNTQ